MSRLEQDRRKIGIELYNQKTIKRIKEKQRLFSGDRASKEYKAEQRKALQSKFIEKTLPEMQLERALSHMFEGAATPEDISYVFRHGDELGPTVIVGGK